MKILIVEDNEDSMVLLQDMLTSSGYEVKSAENGKKALLAIGGNFLPDLIISDILMPEMDGYALCRALKGDDRFRLIPFIFYTATYTDPRDEKFAMSLGASRFLIKPMEMPEFLQEIEMVLEEYKEGGLSVHQSSGKSEHEVEQEYSETLARKLDKKVRELEDERDKLTQSEKKYRRLVEGLRDNYFFYTHDTKGIFTYLSPSITTVLGYSQEEFLTHFTDYLTDNPVNEPVQHHSELSIQGLRQPTYELEIFHKDGSARRLEVTEEPIFDKSGQVVAVEGIANDITKRYEAEQDLAEARDEWEATFQAINDPVIILDPQLRVMRTNLATCTLLKAKAEELIGQHCYVLFHDGNRPCDGCPVSETIKDKQHHFAEVEHKKLEKMFQVSSYPRLDSNGKLISIVHTAKDITDKKHLENKLRQAQKMEAIGTLAGGIAHDFNNILMGILGYSDIVKLGLPVDSPLQKDLDRVITAGNRAKDLVKQILTFSRQTEQENKPVQVQNILKEALKLLRSSIPSTINFQEEIDPNCRAVLADPSQLHQVIMNLCTNAYHAMLGKGGTLAVALTEVEIKPTDYIMNLDLKPGIYVKLEVSDTGIGMEKPDLDRIFEPYFSTKGRGEGTGLGLAVVHGIVKRIDGHITVYSKPGKGTTFHIYLPQPNKHFTTVGEVKSQPDPRGSERVLFVDDEEQLIELGKSILQMLGYQVTALISPVDALQIFQSKPTDFDLVITDMSMPHMTGAELAKKLIDIREDIPIILCTGFSETMNEEKAKTLGIRRYIMKPVIKSEFAQVIREVLDCTTAT